MDHMYRARQCFNAVFPRCREEERERGRERDDVVMEGGDEERDGGMEGEAGGGVINNCTSLSDAAVSM